LSGRVGDLPILRAPSGVDPDVVRFAREREREIKTDGGRPVITYCGPMWKEKGFDTFIELIWHVNRTRAGVEFQVLLRPDSPAESEEARRFVERERTFLSRNRVHVETRKLPRNEFLRALCASTVVVFPLQYSISMTPVSLLEALALGIPIVTTPVGELNGVVEGPACAVSHDYSAARIATALFNLLETLTVNGSHRSLEAEPPRMWGTSVRDWVEFIQDSEPCVS
jgi:glycosyltransferase involved in cell wall biosynthesis